MLNWFRSIRFRLAVMVLFAVLPAFLLSGYLAYSQYQHVLWEADGRAQRLGGLAASDVYSVVEGTRMVLVAISELQSVRQANAEDCNAQFAELLTKYPRLLNFGVLDLEGNIWCSALPQAGITNSADRLWFQRVLETQTFAGGEFQIGRITHKPSLNFGYPVYDETGTLSGVVFAAMDISWISPHIESVDPRTGSVFVLLDQNGTILTRYPDPDAWTGKSFPETELFKIITANQKGVKTVPGLDGVERVFAFEPIRGIPTGDIYAAFGLSVADLTAASNRIWIEFFVLLVALTIVTSVIVFVYGGRYFVYPIDAIQLAALKISRGEQGARTNATKSAGELGELAMAFDRMAESLETRNSQLLVTDDELGRANRALKTLSTGNRTVLHARSEDSIYQEFSDIPVTVGGYRLAWIGRVKNGVKGGVEIIAKSGAADVPLDELERMWKTIPAGQNPVRICVGTGKPYMVRDVENDPNMSVWMPLVKRFGFGSLVCLPVVVDDVVEAVFVIHAAEANAFAGDEVNLLDEMAADLSYGIQTVRVRLKNEEGERALRASEQRYRTYMEQSVDGVFVMHDNGEFMDVNPAACAILGYERKELLGMNIRDLITDGEDVQRLGLEFLINVIKTGRFSRDIQFARKDGTKMYVDVRAVALGENRNLGLFRDITERKQYETKLQEFNALTTTFLRIVSHQLRTPLNSIRWNLEALLTEQFGRMNRQQKEFLRVTLQSNTDVIERIRDLMLAMDIEEGRMAVHLEKASLESLVGSVMTSSKRLCDARRVSCHIKISRKKIPEVRLDAEKMRLVIEKLVQNAVIYTPTDGEISVHVLTREQAVRIEVTDTGVGIPRADQAHIFTRFYRATNASQMQPDASGLGLYIAKRYMEAQGGKIGFTSKQGKGTTFWVELPAVH